MASVEYLIAHAKRAHDLIDFIVAKGGAASSKLEWKQSNWFYVVTYDAIPVPSPPQEAKT